MDKISWKPVTKKLGDLIPWDRNPREIEVAQARRLVKGWEEFGQVETVAIGPGGDIYNGHQRLKVLMAAYGPEFEIDARESSRDLSEQERKDLTLLLHKGAIGRWDWDRMSDLFSVDELLLGGFSREELIGSFDFEKIGDSTANPRTDDREELQAEWKTELGQIWLLGNHRLMCGDATKADDVEALLDGAIPMICVCDPPYGVNYDPNWRADAAEKGDLFYRPARVGNVKADDRVDWSPAYSLYPGDVLYVWHSGVHTAEVAEGIERAGYTIRNQLIWRKSNFPVSRGHYHWRHEPLWYAVRNGGKARWIGGRKQTTIWDINLDRNAQGGHSTQKPLECMARPIRNHEGDVYDPFVGTGTTIFAAENEGRQSWAMDIDPGYVAVTLQRWVDSFPDGPAPQLALNFYKYQREGGEG